MASIAAFLLATKEAHVRAAPLRLAARALGRALLLRRRRCGVASWATFPRRLLLCREGARGARDRFRIHRALEQRAELAEPALAVLLDRAVVPALRRRRFR